MIVTLIVSMAVIGTVQQHGAPGQLQARPEIDGGPARILPLLKTDVTVDIAGIAARVTLVQTFTNPYPAPIEAVYTFPMRSSAAVDRMRIKIGDRIIEGEIKRAEEARRIYEAARAAGQTAALLDQERPNIFTQSVANIMPGAEVQIEISYVDVLDYEDGEFEFVFPMVVGPRNTMNAVDPGKIAPPITPEGTRTGADISLDVFLDAGAELDGVTSKLHAIDVRRQGNGKFRISLSRKDEIPNRDFILRWSPAGDGLQESFLTHASGGKGTFCLTLFPPERLAARYVASRELVFVIDQSGSQQGYPIEKSKELTLAMLDQLGPNDTFNVVTFTTTADFLWPQAMPNVVERVREARDFIGGLTAEGGTNFVPPLRATITHAPRDARIKMIVFNSDGYIGDEFQILDLVQRFSHNARLFTFGIGNSVNRFLIDAMSKEGRGASEIVTLESDVGPAIKRFIKRTQSPVLTDVRIQAAGGGVHDITPEVVPDMFSTGPLVVFGRFEQPGPAKITVSGRLGGAPWQRTIDVVFPAEGDSGEGITKAWARGRLDDMIRKDWLAAVRSAMDGANGEHDVQPYVDFALEHGIMSQWTSFVAVEERVVNIGGRQRTVRVPVEMAAGVSYEGVLGVQGRGSGQYNLGQAGGWTVPTGLASAGGSAGWFYQRGSMFAGSRPGTFARATNPVFRNYATGGAVGGAGGAAATRARTLATQGWGRSIHGNVDLARLSALMPHQVKIHNSLLERKEGSLEVQVMVIGWPDDWKKLIEEAGLKVEDSLEGLKVVFGTIDAKKLEELAKLEFVTEIRPIEDETGDSRE